MWLTADTLSQENRLGDVRVGRSRPTSSPQKLGTVASISIPFGGRAVGPSSRWHLGSLWLSHQRSYSPGLSPPAGPQPCPHSPAPPPRAGKPPAAPLPAAAAARPRSLWARAVPTPPAASAPAGRAGTGAATASGWLHTAAGEKAQQLWANCPDLQGHHKTHKTASLPGRPPHKVRPCPGKLTISKESIYLMPTLHFLGVQTVKNPPAMQETQDTWIWSLSWEDPLEEGMATHSSNFPWRIPRTEELGRLKSMGSQTGLSD